MNSEKDAGQVLPDETDDIASSDAAAESDGAQTADAGDESLQRSQEAIDQGREAEQSALKDTLPDEDLND
jgi:hypothetical protein